MFIVRVRRGTPGFFPADPGERARRMSSGGQLGPGLVALGAWLYLVYRTWHERFEPEVFPGDPEGREPENNSEGGNIPENKY